MRFTHAIKGRAATNCKTFDGHRIAADTAATTGRLVSAGSLCSPEKRALETESFRKQFRDAGWKENFAAIEGMSRAVSFSKGDGQSVNITYCDTGFMPT